VVVAPVGVHELHAFAGSDERARRLEEHAGLVDLLHQVAVVDPLVGERLLEVLLVVHGCGDDLPRVGDRAEKLDALDGDRLSRVRGALDLRPQLGEMRDQRVVPREG